MAEVHIKDIDEHEIDTILAEDIDFEGHLTFKKPLMIKGKFKGEIKSTSSLYIGEKAYVEAATEAGIVSSKGRHKGNIVGHARVELFSTAQVDGDITTPDFVVESGCKFNGNCNMSGGPKKEAHAAAAPSAGSAGQQQPQQGGQQVHAQQPQQGGQQAHAQQPQQQQGQQGAKPPNAGGPSQQPPGQQQGGQQRPQNSSGSSGGQQR
ncbi:MAG: polymer-forming cytoskeletal protein [Spirochaetia bacterium]|jgi:cytoskeletal protein CcmA (bactofilin family)